MPFEITVSFPQLAMLLKWETLFQKGIEQMSVATDAVVAAADALKNVDAQLKTDLEVLKGLETKQKASIDDLTKQVNVLTNSNDPAVAGAAASIQASIKDLTDVHTSIQAIVSPDGSGVPTPLPVPAPANPISKPDPASTSTPSPLPIG